MVLVPKLCGTRIGNPRENAAAWASYVADQHRFPNGEDL